MVSHSFTKKNQFSSIVCLLSCTLCFMHKTLLASFFVFTLLAPVVAEALSAANPNVARQGVRRVSSTRIRPTRRAILKQNTRLESTKTSFQRRQQHLIEAQQKRTLHEARIRQKLLRQNADARIGLEHKRRSARRARARR